MSLTYDVWKDDVRAGRPIDFGFVVYVPERTCRMVDCSTHDTCVVNRELGNGDVMSMEFGYKQCSACGAYVFDCPTVRYCPNCGARVTDPSDMSQGRRDIVACDRDALLRLARYMDKDVAETEAHFSNVISTKSVSDYARRIRKALGVES